MNEHAKVDSYFVFVSTHHDQLAVWCETEHKDSLCSHVYAGGKRGFCVATSAMRDDDDDRYLILVPTRVGSENLQRLVDEWTSAA